jgi:hypothetical protein
MIDEQMFVEINRLYYKYIDEIYLNHCDNYDLIMEIEEDRNTLNHF